jgi:hypothetical protein
LLAPLYVAFQHPVSPDFLESNLSFSPAVEGRITSLDGRSFAFTPEPHWSPGTEYTVAVAGAQTPVILNFSTRPLVTAQLPKPLGWPRVDIHRRILLTFGYPADGDAIASALHIEPDIPVRVESNGRVLSVIPEEGWAYDTTYTLTLDGPSLSSEGIPFGLLAPWSFRTRSGVLSSAPSSPASWDSVISLHFATPVDRATVERALQFSPPISGTFEWEGERMRFTPNTGLKAETSYRAYLFPTVRTLDGKPILQGLYSWRFTTGPTVSNFGPRHRAPWYEPIWLDFDRPVDRESVEAAFRITPTVAGAFEWQDRSVRFVPADGLQVDTTYRVELDTSALAADGSPLLHSPLSWEFGALRSGIQIDFGGGPNVQVLDAAGPRLIQFGRNGRQEDVPWVQLGLYQLSPEQLLSTYSSSFKGEAPISVEGLPLVHRWREEVTVNELTLPPNIPPGLYVLTAGELCEKQDELLVVLTHHTLVLKDAGVGTGSSAWHQVTGYAREIASDRPRPAMTVRLYDRAGRLAAEGTTDDNGLFETMVQGDTEPLLALGQFEGEWTLCGLGREWTARESGCVSCQWWGWWSPTPAGRAFRSYVYTDRPIYRPGQTVHARAIVRADDDGIYSLPPIGTPVKVRLRDARDNVIGTKELACTPPLRWPKEGPWVATTSRLWWVRRSLDKNSRSRRTANRTMRSPCTSTQNCA